MNRIVPVLAVLVLAGCNKPTPETPATASTAAAPAAPAPAASMAMPAAPVVRQATASGIVKSVDAAARTITISHGPVPALDWPGMTMAFKAPDIDLTQFKAGDRIEFDFTASGMDGTIVAARKP